MKWIHGGLWVWRFTGAYVFQSSLGEKRRPTGDLAPWASWCWWEGQTLVNSMAGNDLRNNATKQCSMFSGFYCFVLRKVPNAFARSTYPRSPHIPLPHTLAWPPAWAGEGFARKNEKTQIPSHEISKSDIAYSLAQCFYGSVWRKTSPVPYINKRKPDENVFTTLPVSFWKEDF